MFPQYPAVGEEPKRRCPPSGHVGPFFGGVFHLKIKFSFLSKFQDVLLDMLTISVLCFEYGLRKFSA
jgi:hypothetical protein